jgi:hypothetical protein
MLICVTSVRRALLAFVVADGVLISKLPRLIFYIKLLLLLLLLLCYSHGVGNLGLFANVLASAGVVVVVVVVDVPFDSFPTGQTVRNAAAQQGTASGKGNHQSPKEEIGQAQKVRSKQAAATSITTATAIIVVAVGMLHRTVECVGAHADHGLRLEALVFVVVEKAGGCPRTAAAVPAV